MIKYTEITCDSMIKRNTTAKTKYTNSFNSFINIIIILKIIELHSI